MAAGNYDFTCDAGSTFQRSITYRDSNEAAVNLTGYTARMQVRTTPSAATTLLSLANGSGLTLGGSAGTIAINVSAADTQALPKGRHYYDLEVVQGSTVTRLISGRFRVTEEVTR